MRKKEKPGIEAIQRRMIKYREERNEAIREIRKMRTVIGKLERKAKNLSALVRLIRAFDKE